MISKFRGWHKELEQMIYGKEVCGHIEYTTNLIDALNTMLNEDDYDIEVMQSTGLKDKNGVEIFEGDVLTSNVQPCKMVNPIKDGYGVVRFENGMFKLGAISLVTFISKMEVIGNIYENPNLLEQANEN